jgi:hypothetical protein
VKESPDRPVDQKPRRRHPIAGRRGAILAKLVGGVAENVGLRSHVELSGSRKLPTLPGWVDVRGPTADVILTCLTYDEGGIAVATLLVSRGAERPLRRIPRRPPRPVRECASPLHQPALRYAERLARIIGGKAMDLSSRVNARIIVDLGDSRKLRGLDGALEVRDRRVSFCVWDLPFDEARAILECLVFMREHRRKKRK